MPPKKKSKQSDSVDASELAFLRTMVSKTKKALECICCLEVAIPPLFQCKNGHSLPCSDCRSKLAKSECPSCKVAFDDDTKARNLFLEQSAADIGFECKRGCGKLIVYCKLADHDKDCVGEAPVTCIKPTCKHKSKLWSTAIEHHMACYGDSHGDIETGDEESYDLRQKTDGIMFHVCKSSKGHHWTVCESDSGGHCAHYVKIFGHLPATPTEVGITISSRDVEGKSITHQTTRIEASSALSTDKDVLQSGNISTVNYNQLMKWNGGEALDNGILENLSIDIKLKY